MRIMCASLLECLVSIFLFSSTANGNILCRSNCVGYEVQCLCHPFSRHFNWQMSHDSMSFSFAFANSPNGTVKFGDNFSLRASINYLNETYLTSTLSFTGSLELDGTVIWCDGYSLKLNISDYYPTLVFTSRKERKHVIEIEHIPALLSDQKSNYSLDVITESILVHFKYLPAEFCINSYTIYNFSFTNINCPNNSFSPYSLAYAMKCPFLDVSGDVELIKFVINAKQLVAVISCSTPGLDFTLECSDEKTWHGNYSCGTSQNNLDMSSHINSTLLAPNGSLTVNPSPLIEILIGVCAGSIGLVLIQSIIIIILAICLCHHHHKGSLKDREIESGFTAFSKKIFCQDNSAYSTGSHHYVQNAQFKEIPKEAESMYETIPSNLVEVDTTTSS